MAPFIKALQIIAGINVFAWAIYFWVLFCWTLSAGKIWGLVLCLVGLSSGAVMVFAIAEKLTSGTKD